MASGSHGTTLRRAKLGASVCCALGTIASESLLPGASVWADMADVMAPACQEIGAFSRNLDKLGHFLICWAISRFVLGVLRPFLGVSYGLTFSGNVSFFFGRRWAN